MTHYLETPQGGFAYVLERRPRRRSLGLQVKADGQVLVAVPPFVAHASVRRFLQEKSAWVHGKLAEVARLRRMRAGRSYAEGGAVRYLGREFELRFAGKTRLDTAGKVLHLGLRGEPERARVTAALERWYRKQALCWFAERALPLADRLGRRPAHLGVKGYRTRWGSCHADGRIYLNWRLMMAPEEIGEYVLAHELAHLVRADHSPAFWRQVEMLVPDYRAPRRWLREHGRELEL